MAEEEEEEEVQPEGRQATAWTKSSSIHHLGRVKEEDFSPIGFVVRKGTTYLIFDFGWCPSRLAHPTAEAWAAGN